MSTIRALLAISGVAIFGVAVGAAGCAEPGVVQVNPTGKNVNKRDAGTKPKPEPADDDEEVEMEEEPAKADEDEPDEDEPKTPVKEADAGKKDPVKEVDAGTKPVAEKDAGPAKPDKLPACPSGYMCTNPAGPLEDMGLEGTITDSDGKAVTASCSKGGQMDCDQKDPKKSCPDFSNPFCAHVKLTGLLSVDLYQCAQKCDP